jgi:S1-C subfamily serine protease
LLAFLAGATIAAASFGLGVTLTADEPARVEGAAAPTPVSGARSEDTTPPTPVPQATSTDPVAIVAAALGPSVLQVETDRGLGSGVVYADGLILTNHHVIDGAEQVRVRTSDGRTFDADVLGSDARNDIAVLAVGQDSGLPVAPLAADADLSVGQLAVAIGSPFELSQTVTAGIVSALNRPVPNTAGGFNAMIQTDAPINPGNSGGALADGAGRVIGINTSIRTDGTSNGNLGIGFAVPIDTALGVASRITSGASLDAGILGVMSATDVDNEIGVIIGEVVDGGAADVAGLVAGDRVITIDGAPVTNFGEVVGLVQSKFAGDRVDIEVIRNNERFAVSATLG